jgi:hypothetical protein
MVVCISLGVDVVNGSLPSLIYPGGQGYKNPGPILDKESYPNTTRVDSFCTEQLYRLFIRNK